MATKILRRESSQVDYIKGVEFAPSVIPSTISSYPGAIVTVRGGTILDQFLDLGPEEEIDFQALLSSQCAAFKQQLQREN